MIILPAIDMLAGKCVRLTQGKFQDEVVYSEDPVAMAKRWESEGAPMLHLVDLDGARNGKLTNLDTIKQILNSVGIPAQLGGGIRDERTVEMVLDLGVRRVVIGTAALEDENFLRGLVNKYSSRIVVALDAKKGKLVKRGWQEKTDKDILETAQRLKELGVARFVFTDVIKDGTLTTPNYPLIALLLERVDAHILVAGGISSSAQIKKLKSMGVEGAIIGKALYEGKVDLKEVLCVSETNHPLP